MEPGNPLELVGRGFAPGEPVEITRDNVVIDTLLAGPDGTVQASIPWSDWHPGEAIDPARYYFIRAKDSYGNSDFTIVEVGPPCP